MKIIPDAVRDFFFKGAVKPAAHAKRNYAAAAGGRLTADFPVAILSPDAALWGQVTPLRARARHLERNNPYMRKFLQDAEKNVLGSTGIGLHSKARTTGDLLDKPANSLIELGWTRWGKRKNCCTNRRQSLLKAKRLLLRSMLRDGGVLIRLVRGFPNNPFGFAIQPIEYDHLDVNYTVDRHPLTNNPVRLGVEFNEWGEQIAFHLLVRHPGDYLGSIGQQTPMKRERISSRDMIHAYLPDRINQTIGVTGASSVMLNLQNLAAYEYAECIAARVGASKLGFFKKTIPDHLVGSGQELPEDFANGKVIQDLDPGSVTELPLGFDFVGWSPDHPNTGYPEARKGFLRGIASGLGVSYNFLGSDLTGVNFSSLRSGALDERETWKMLQVCFIEEVLEPIYEAWLEMALMSGQVPLRLADFDRLNEPEWSPRRWDWVDPSKDIAAAVAAIDAGLTSRRKVVADRGADIEDVFEDQERDNELAAEHGLDFSKKAAATPAAPASTENDEDDEEDDQDDTEDESESTKSDKARDVAPPATTTVIHIHAKSASVVQPMKKSFTFNRDNEGRTLGGDIIETVVATPGVEIVDDRRNGHATPA